MANDRSDPLRLWGDVALLSVKAYASALATGLDMTSRLLAATPDFPAPAIRRSRPIEMWPAAGSFGGSNAVGAWVDATQAMMGVSKRPAAFGYPMTWAALPLTPMSALTGWPMGMPWGGMMGWMMPAFRFPFGAPAPMNDPLQLMRMLNPMLDALTPGLQRSFRYH